MAVHGYVRATLDLDILVVTSALRLPRVFEIVRRQGFDGEDRALIEAIRSRFVAALHSGPVTVEILVPVLPYHRRVLERAVSRRLGGQSVPVVTVEDLVVLKMLWHRAKDVPDVHALVAAAPALDATYVRETLRDILPDGDPRRDEFEEILRRLRGGGGGTVPGPDRT
jgi:predicted nucleotidyltransferase